MGYFDEVYLKRINKDGRNQQDRIKTRKEKEFDMLFLQKTEYQVHLYGINDEEVDILGSLQPNRWNESRYLSNLLLSTSAATLKTGDLLSIKQKIKDKEKDEKWLVLFVEDNLTKGYQLFKVILLDEDVSFTDEYGTSLEVFPAKFVNSSSNFVQDTFIHSHSQRGYREPFSTRTFITKEFDFIKKGIHFEYKNRRWEIVGFDNLSIDGVSYVTISERLQKENEPVSSKDIPIGEDDNFFLIGT